MPTTQLIAFIAAALAIAAWQVFALRAAYHGSSVRQLRDVAAPPLEHYPRLSVIVTARNEERQEQPRTLRTIGGQH